MTNQPAPTCPRHSERVAYVQCQRCGRPTCADCQRPAAVGIQCVDCVNQSARTAPKIVNRFGGRAVGSARPVVTIGLIGVCTIIYIAQLASSRVTDDLYYAPVLSGTEPWRFITAVFLHDPNSPFHLLFNMYALWLTGSYLEPLLGRVRFFALFMIAGFGGSVGYELLASTPQYPGDFNSGWVSGTLGASGAVFGLFLAVIVLNLKLHRDISAMVTIVVLNAVLGFVVGGIAWQAHLGGAVTGAVCAFALSRVDPKKAALQWGSLAAITLVLVVLAVVKYHSVVLPGV